MMWWLVLVIPVVSWWPRGRDLHEKRARVVVWTVMVGLLIARLMPNTWLAAYTVVFLAGLWRVPSPADRLPLTVTPALLVPAVYVLLAPQVTRAWVAPCLWSIVACGLMLFAWWAFSLWRGQGHYDWTLTWNGHTLLHLYEHQPVWNGVPKFCCGQGNENFAQALAGASAASALGLILLGSHWAYGALLLTSLPLLKIRGHWWEWPQPSQGWGYLLAIGGAVLVLQAGWIGALVVGLLVSGGAWYTIVHHRAHWSGRLEMWAYGWQVWKDMRLTGRLIGAGPESWIHIFQQDAEHQYERIKHQTAFATHPHNEFVCELVERGILGLGAMVLYLVTAMLGLWGAGPEGQALFVLGAMLIACACVSFPFCLYHEMAFMDRGDVSGHGMPILNVISMTCVILTEGVLR